MDAAIYARVSTPGQKSVPDQLAECRSYAASQGWNVVLEQTDEGISAFKEVERPGFEAVRKAAEEGAFKALLVYSFDRLSRGEAFRSLIALRWEFRELGVSLYSVTQPTPEDELVTQIIDAVEAQRANSQSKVNSQKVTLAIRNKAREGKPPHGGPRPFGYDRQRNIIPDEAAIIQEAAKRLLKGEYISHIIRDFHERGIRSPSGKPLEASSFKRTITAIRNAGHREYQGQIVARDAWEPILDEATIHKLNPIINRKARSTPRSFLLSGLLYCHCGSQMYGSYSGTKETSPGRYSCTKRNGLPNCGKCSTRAAKTEELVWNMLLIRLKASKIDLEPSEDVEQLVSSLNSDRESLAQATQDHYVNRILDREAFKSVQESLSKRISETEQALASLERGNILEGLSVEEITDFGSKRTLLEAIISRIEVAPHPTDKPRSVWVPERINVVWKA